MVDEVARAICDAAGRTGCGPEDVKPECVMCDRDPSGKLVCSLWPSFRFEAQQAIIAAHKWHKKERRWPAFVTANRA